MLFGDLVTVEVYAPDQCLVVEVPHGNVSDRPAGEAHLAVGRDSEGVARWRRRRQLGLNARRWLKCTKR